MGISTVFRMFKPAPFLPELSDSAVIKEKYQYWRIRTFYSIYLGYFFYYFTRKSFTFITPFMSEDLHLSKTNIGILISILSVTYGISRFTSGVLSDKSNPRYFMAVGLLLTGICNILFGFSSSIVWLGIFWGLNGWFQGFGWSACTKQLTYWFSSKERGTWYSACSTSYTAGAFIIAFLAPKSAELWGWRYGMFIPGVICIVAGLWLINRLRDVPQSLGLPTVEKFKGEELFKKETGEAALPIKQILFQHVFNNKYVWILSISFFFVYVIRTAVNDWGPLYLAEMKDFSRVSSSNCVSLFEAGGFIGILLAGFGSDRWFQGKRVPIMVISAALLALTLLGLWYLKSGEYFQACILMGLIGFLVFAPQMLVGLAAAEFVSKKAASTSNGFATCFGYFGAAVAGYPLGKIIESYGWYGFVWVLAGCALITTVLLLPIWSLRAADAKKRSKPEFSATSEVFEA